MRHTGPHGIALIKQFEGFASRAYKCPAGVWTIGYGHTQGVKKGDVCGADLANKYLTQDLIPVEQCINKWLADVPLTQNQFDALASFIFNVGQKRFINSTLRRKLAAKDYAGAAAQFARWVYGGDQDGDGDIDKNDALPGLVKRRAAEKALFLSKD